MELSLLFKLRFEAASMLLDEYELDGSTGVKVMEEPTFIVFSDANIS